MITVFCVPTNSRNSNTNYVFRGMDGAVGTWTNIMYFRAANQKCNYMSSQ